jgi:HD-like signal output (HDOD) protein
MDEALRGKIEAHIKHMGCLSATRLKVLEVCNNPRINPADIKRALSLDPVLVGRTLKLVNSAYSGMEGQAVNLVRVITMLGINTVKNLALYSAGVENFDVGTGLDAGGYWLHSLCVGLTAKCIARKRGVNPRLLEEYYAAGLLHDIGKLCLNAALPGEYPAAVRDAASRKMPLFQGETERLGLNHNEAGELAAKAWRIEGALGDAVIHHHNYTDYRGEHKDLLYSIVAADYFAAVMETGFSGSPYPRKPENTVWETLGIAWEDVEGMKPAVDEEIKKARVFLAL